MLRGGAEPFLGILVEVFHRNICVKLFSLKKNFKHDTQNTITKLTLEHFLFMFLFVCFVALHPKSTAMVIAGRSVHLTTLFPGQA